MPETVAAARSAQQVARSSHALLVVDDDCLCVEASLGACRLLGAARRDVVGRSVEDLLEVDSRERFGAFWGASSRTGGHADSFALEAPAPTLEVGLTVTPRVLPARHLIALDAGTDADWDRAGRTEPRTEASAQPPAAPAMPRLPSVREREVLRLLAGGATDGQIAARLSLSPATVQTHVRNAKARLGARTRAQAVALALRGGLIDAP